MRASVIVTIVLVLITLTLGYAAAAPTLERLDIFSPGEAGDSETAVSETPAPAAETSPTPTTQTPKPTPSPTPEPSPPDVAASPALPEQIIITIPNKLLESDNAFSPEKFLDAYCLMQDIPEPVKGDTFYQLTLSERQHSELKSAISTKISTEMGVFEADTQRNGDLTSIRCNSDYTILSVIPKSDGTPMDASRFYDEEFMKYCLLYQSITDVAAPIVKINFIDASGKILTSGQYPSAS